MSLDQHFWSLSESKLFPELSHLSLEEEVQQEGDDGKNRRHQLKEPLLSNYEDGRGESVDATDTSIAESLYQSTSRNPKETNFLRRAFWSLFEIYTDQSGSWKNICHGLSIAFLLGTCVGIRMPQNDDLPTLWYRYVSSILGYTYFFCWSISFYPQIMINIERRSVAGLSTDSSVMAAVNFASYAAYCTFFFFDKAIRQEYKDRHGQNSKIMIESSDVAFSLHAFIMTLVVMAQIAYFGGYRARPISKVTIYFVCSISFVCISYAICVLLHISGFLWIDFLYILAMIKLALTVTTYIPQLLLNFHRKSTSGYNIWNILLDFAGGSLSLLQLLFDSMDSNDIMGGIQGNWAKFLLSIISLVFDSVFFFQHFFLYAKNNQASALIQNGSKYPTNPTSGTGYRMV